MIRVLAFAAILFLPAFLLAWLRRRKVIATDKDHIRLRHVEGPKR